MPGYADQANWLEVGLVVYRRRIQLDINSQREMAERAGVHVNTISRLERGIPSTRRNPSWSAIERVLGWRRGYIHDMVETGVEQPEPFPLAALVERAVLETVAEIAPDVTVRQQRMLAQGVVARLRRRGVIPEGNG